MHVHVRGLKDKYLRRMTHRAVEYCAKKLLSRQMLPFITVDINYTFHTDADGYCWCDADSGKKPRSFVMEIDKRLPIEEIMTTIVHEMIHVKQWAKGELIDAVEKGAVVSKWKGSTVADHVDYMDLPWEVEAYEQEPILFDQMKRDLLVADQRYVRKTAR